MLKSIAEVSAELLSFIEALQLSLSKPQKQHVAQVADALITTEGSKTICFFLQQLVYSSCLPYTEVESSGIEERLKEVMTMAESYNLAVIGAGMGGINVAKRAALMNARVAIIEQGKVGGT